ncbi:hypothetical protein AM305_07773 [Actinobacillus minor NM305]|uniref:Uncharacterized protein n=1 Tax=Actinobacillus minor NM305 TaxID=637911 RepID=C5S0X9_9PAST|nr:hypothetical protein AM305_07773 [Actinobacillus minor NM305]
MFSPQLNYEENIMKREREERGHIPPKPTPPPKPR